MRKLLYWLDLFNAGMRVQDIPKQIDKIRFQKALEDEIEHERVVFSAKRAAG